MTISFGQSSYPTVASFREMVSFRILAIPRHRPLVGADHDFVMELLQRKADWSAKVGAGIEHFRVLSNGSGVEIRFRRVDGTESNFSWRKAMTGYAPAAGAYINAALRFAVVEQVHGFKRQSFGTSTSTSASVTSAISGEVLTWQNAEVDHLIPFCEIRDAWTASLDTPVEFTRETNGLKTSAVMSNPEQLRSWLAYHGRVELRIISREENQKLGRLLNV
jgi:hypothetical protein